MPTATSSITSLNNQGGTGVLSTGQASFGDNAFLKLLTEQLRNQTPLEPVDNAAFMNQMASYTTMQEQRDLNGNMLKLLDYQGVLARMQGLGQGSALLGKEVTYLNDEGKAATGTVASVYVAESGDVRLKLGNGADVEMRKITGITQAS
ncbi:MAG: hypothetical protein JNK49_07965 [Planctomycetes bacterium]|nr:hypothetical protein [Planctomycetota bacterium]